MAMLLVPWSDSDAPLLVAQNSAEMTAFLGGPESEEKLAERHARYLHLFREGLARMFRIEVDGTTVGSIGWWQSEWHDQSVQEAGWAVLPEHQGRGYATDALRLLLRDAADHGTRALLVANPRNDNAASNAVCARAGFSFRGEEADEYPPGNPIRSNVWTFDIGALREARSLGYDR